MALRFALDGRKITRKELEKLAREAIEAAGA